MSTLQDTAQTAATLMREQLRRRAIRDLGVSVIAGTVQIRMSALWPFPIDPATQRISSGGTELTIAVGIAPELIIDDPDRAADYVQQRIEAEITMRMLPLLIDRAREIGVHRKALAPYAIEVVDRLATALQPQIDPGYVRWVAAPFTLQAP